MRRKRPLIVGFAEHEVKKGQEHVEYFNIHECLADINNVDINFKHSLSILFYDVSLQFFDQRENQT